MTVGTTHGRGASLAARLSRAGVADVPRGERLLTDQALLAVWPQAPEDLPELLGAVADPDQALLTLAKVAGAVGPHPDLRQALVAAVTEAGPARERLLSLAGASAALGDVVVARPESLRVNSYRRRIARMRFAATVACWRTRPASADEMMATMRKMTSASSSNGSATVKV